MSKNKPKHICKCNDNNKYDEAPEFDFSELINAGIGDETVSEVFRIFIENSNNQMNQAIELTKLIVNRNPDSMNTAEIHEVFIKSINVVINNTPIKELLEKFSMS